jgi:hypothetical protein
MWWATFESTISRCGSARDQTQAMVSDILAGAGVAGLSLATPASMALSFSGLLQELLEQCTKARRELRLLGPMKVALA